MADITKIQPIGSSTQYELGARYLTTARTLTIGNTGKTFNGTANVSWTLSEIGAAAASHTHSYAASSHTHSYLPLSGGTLTGQLYINYDQDVGKNQNGSLIIGNKTGENIGIDANEIMARNNSAVSTLYLNSEGGIVYAGAGGIETPGGLRIWTSTAGASGFYNGGAGIEIREVGTVTTNQSNWNYAPKIGFHWGGRYQGVFGLHSNGEFYLGISGSAVNGILHTGKTYGAVWNDYAEMRNVPEMQKEESILKPGMCVREVGDGTMVLSTSRLERGCKIISDTFGFNIGETDDCKTPIAVSGRVLVYLNEDREIAAQHIGWPVCSGPNGTVSIMTEEEEEKYPSRIIGTISEIPNYEIWGSGNVFINNRIWIYVR